MLILVGTDVDPVETVRDGGEPTGFVRLERESRDPAGAVTVESDGGVLHHGVIATDDEGELAGRLEASAVQRRALEPQRERSVRENDLGVADRGMGVAADETLKDERGGRFGLRRGPG